MARNSNRLSSGVTRTSMYATKKGCLCAKAHLMCLAEAGPAVAEALPFPAQPWGRRRVD